MSDELERMRQEPVVQFVTERTETSRLFLIYSIIEIEYRNKYGLISALSFGKGQVLACPILADFRKSYFLEVPRLRPFVLLGRAI